LRCRRTIRELEKLDPIKPCDIFHQAYISPLAESSINSLLIYACIENLERIKAGGVKEWLAEEEKKWVCRECENPISDSAKCHWCGAELGTK